jgi:hypothetical protein
MAQKQDGGIFLMPPHRADVVKLAYTAVFKTAISGRDLWVRVPPPAPT